MESVKKNRLNGSITEDEYREAAVNETVTILKNSNFNVIKSLGFGSFGVVVEVEHPTDGKLAAKIVLEENVSESEKELWPLLRHENILPLFKMGSVRSADTHVFLMPRHPTSLSHLIEDMAFYTNINAFDRALSYLKGIARGIEYLHVQNICHLDIKLCNILITEEDKPVLCDFGSLTRTNGATRNYGAPFIYSAPEANIRQNIERVPVDGFKFDIYTLGILALELFTNESVWRSPRWEEADPCWAEVMYSRIFDILRRQNFARLVKKTFFMNNIKMKTIMSIRNFIVGCISLNPLSRPSMAKVLEHPILGGEIEFPIRMNDVWRKRASLKKIQFLVSLFIGHAAALEMKDFFCKVKRKNDHLVQSDVDNDEESRKVNSDVSLGVTERKLNRKQRIQQWVTGKKANLNKMFNRILDRFRK